VRRENVQRLPLRALSRAPLSVHTRLRSLWHAFRACTIPGFYAGLGCDCGLWSK